MRDKLGFESVRMLELKLLKISCKTCQDFAKVILALNEDDAEYVFWEKELSILITNIEAIRCGLKNTIKLLAPHRIYVSVCRDGPTRWLRLFVPEERKILNEDFLIEKVLSWESGFSRNLRSMLERYYRGSIAFQLVIDTPYFAKSSIEKEITRHSGSILITHIYFESTEDGTLKEYWNGGGVFMDISQETHDYNVAKSLIPVGYWYCQELEAFWWLLGKIVKIKEA